MHFDRRSAGVTAAGLATFLNLYVTQALMPPLATTFGVSTARTGITVTAPLLAVALVAPFVGSVSDMLGRKRLIAGAAILLVIPTLLAATSASLHALVLWRFIQGLLLPFIFAVTVAYISEEAPGPDAIRLTGTYSVGTFIAGFSGRFLSGIAADLAGWRAAFVLMAVLTAICAAMIVWFLPMERRFRPVRGIHDTLASYGDHLTNPRLIATFALGFGLLFSIVATFTFVNVHLAAPPYLLGPAALGSIFVVYLAAMGSTPIAARLAVRIGRRRTLVLTTATGIAGLALTLLAPLPLIVLGLGLIAGGFLPQQTLAISYVGSAARSAKSTAVGLYVTAYYIGGSLGGVLPAGLWHLAGWPGCVALVACVQFLMLAVALTFWREEPAS
jgi:predicted MFS family arabinose efflux permease